MLTDMLLSFFFPLIWSVYTWNVFLPAACKKESMDID